MSTNRLSSGLLILILLVSILLLASCKGIPEIPAGTGVEPGTSQPQISTSGDGQDVSIESRGERYGMDIQLSEGQSGPQEQSALPVISGEPLTAEEVAEVAARLPALPPDETGQQEFKLPVQSMLPPKTGATILEPFPPEGLEPTPETQPGGDLQVLRFSPEGEVPVAPVLSITFNQPMVPVGTLADLALKQVPVSIDPPLEGTWRWLGTRTLTFEYDSMLIDRLPKSTQFHVIVPAGTKSSTGGVLQQTVTWSFTTPPPKVTASYPSGGAVPLQPLIFIRFDQRIDPAAVLRMTTATADGRNFDLLLATADEIAKDETVSRMVEQSLEGRWMVFKSSRPFPPATPVQVVLNPGTPSAEGPLVTVESQTIDFQTYAQFAVNNHGCSWGGEDCQPLTPFYIEFNNPIDTGVTTTEMVRVAPEILGMVVNIYGNSIEIKGQTRGRTKYTVTVDANATDVYGQKLGRDTELTFSVGRSDPVLTGPGQPLVTLDPTSSQPVFSVYDINYATLELQVYAVEPENWLDYKKYLEDWQQTDNPVKMPGKLLVDKKIRPDIEDDTLTQVNIPLEDYLPGGSGHVVVILAPEKPIIETDESRWYRFSHTVISWVQVTHIGLDAFNDQSRLVAWVTNLTDGQPLQGVSITPEGYNRSFLTNSSGSVEMDIPPGARYLVAGLGDDQAILPRSNYVWGDDAWYPADSGDSLIWYVMNDRQMYKPGEEVHIKGWLRKLGSGLNADIDLAGNLVERVFYSVMDPMGNEIGSDVAQVNKYGGFDFRFTIPENANLGGAYINLSAGGSLTNLNGTSTTHGFSIQEFRRPEFEVKARNESTGPYFMDGQAVVAVDANYYAGGALAEADVTWDVTKSSTNYTPPNWPDFTFGSWHPWWFMDYYMDGGDDVIEETFTGKTGMDGSHYLMLDFQPTGDPSVDPETQLVTAQARVMDVNRQEWASSTTLLVHPASEYIGLRSERYFVELNSPLKIDYIVTDLDGNAVPGREVLLTASRMEWVVRDGQWAEEPVETQTCKQVSGLQPGSCSFETGIGGSYKITAQVWDGKGRINQTVITRWVSGGRIKPSRNIEMETATLIPDKETYEPGDVAHILVQSPFPHAAGMLLVSRNGIVESRNFQVEEDTITLDIPIREENIPNLEVQVNLVGSTVRLADDGSALPADVPERPAYASGTLSLHIPPAKRTLVVDAVPGSDQLEPGAETALTVIVTDSVGSPVGDAEILVAVVDESILSLSNYRLANPLDIFYRPLPSNLASVYSRSSIILADPQALAADALEKSRQNEVLYSAQDSMAMGTMMPAAEAPAAPGMGGGGGPQEMIAVRSDFNPLAAFVPSARTGSDGKAEINIKVPDNLTRYRVMVIVVDGSGRQFGTGETNITARLPLMVRSSAPRFLNFGDSIELPVVLQNQTDKPMQVKTVLVTSNLVVETPGYLVTVPANDRIEVRFPAVTYMAGTTRIQVAAVSGGYADAAEVTFPVYTPATTEAFATYGVIDQGASSQPIQYPTGVFEQFGGLQITTSSTALSALTDAYIYLVSYPFECSEQLASRILAVAALKDVLSAFQAEGLPQPEDLQAAIDRDILKLGALQNGDGGFPTWRHGFESNPFNTIHVANALQRAVDKGFTVPTAMQQNVLVYLQQIENYYPAYYTQRTRWILSAYALHVRSLMGDRDAGKAQSLLDEAGVENLPLSATGWLWPLIDDEDALDSIRKYVNNHVVETAGAANFTTAYNEQDYLVLDSDRRTDAILMDAMMDTDPGSDLIPKLVNGLLGHRVKGSWGSTQENVFVLLALDKYFNLYEAQTPDFVASIWLGEIYAGSNGFSGRTTDQYDTYIPMDYVLEQTAGATSDLLISKEGDGRLYYRIGLKYAPVDLQLDELDMGFVVQREYEAVDDPEEVRQDEDGTWHIKAGSRVRVRIKMVADNRRYHVALVDNLPGGLEIVNPALAVSASLPSDPGNGTMKYWWWGPWFEHQNLKDSRAEAFTTLLWEGVYEYTYVARATTPGIFVVPPAKAEEMYFPEVFGRSSSDRVIVE